MAGIAATVRDGVRELRRPGENLLGGPELVRLGRLIISLTIVGTNLIGACAVFGAPRRQPDHADAALSAALTIAAEVTSDDGWRSGSASIQAPSSPAMWAAPDGSSSA